MSRFIVWLMVLCVILLILAHYAKAAEMSGWDELLGNEPEKAKAVFIQKLREEEKNLELYEGLYQSELMLGNLGDAYDTLKKMVEISEGSPLQGLFLLRLGVASDTAGRVGSFYDFANTLAKAGSNIDPYTMTVLGLTENKAFLLSNQFTKAKEALKKSTRLASVSRIVGPVYIPQNYGLNLKTKIEDNLLSSGYNSYDNINADLSGKFKLGSILPNDNRPGVAYIYITLSVKEDVTAALDLFSTSISNVWLNGNLVSSAALYHMGGIGARNSRSIKLHKGKNLLLIKAFRKDSIQVGLRDVKNGGRLAGVEVLPFSVDDWKEAKLNNYSGRIFSKLYLPPFVKEIQEKTSVASALWRNFYYEYTNNFEDGIAYNDKLLKQYNSSALVQFTVGEFYRKYYNFFESKSRSMVMCEKYVRAALKAKPDYILPKLSLVRILVGSSQDSSAIKLLKEIVEQSQEFPWAYRMLAQLYMKKGWIGLANTAIEKYYELSPDSAVEVIDFYLGMSEFSKAESIFVSASEKNQIPLYNMYKILIKMNKPELAKEILDKWYESNPQEGDMYLGALVELAYQDGSYKEIEGYLEKSLEKNPNNAGLAESMGINYIRMGEMSKGVEWLERAHQFGMEYNQSMPNLPRRIEADTTGKFELVKYDIPLSDIDLNKVRKEDHDRASFANVLNIKVIKIFPDLSIEGYEHRAFKIFDNAGLSQLAELNVGQGEIIECRTVSPNGEVFVPESSENLSLDKAISMYNASVGSVIEYSKRIMGKSAAKLEDGFEFSSINNPVIRSRYVLVLPKGMLGRISIDGSEPEVKMSGDDIIMVWDGEESEGVEQEAFMPREIDAIDNVKITVYSSEKEDPGLISLSLPLLTNNGIEQTAKEICSDSKTTKEKVAVIYKWIAENIQSNADSKSARDTFILKGGTVDSRARLMQVMLDEVGVVSYPLWSNIPFSIAGRLGEQDRVKSVAEFTMPIILRIKNEDPAQNDFWVKITEDMRENRPENIGTLAVGSLALEKSPLGVRLGTVRENEIEGVRIITPEVNILSNGAAEVKGGVEFFGSSAAAPRKVFYNPQHAQQYVAQVAAQLFPGITDATYTYPSIKELEEGINNWDESLVLTCSGKVLNYCSRRGSALYINPLKEGEFVRDLIVREPRIHPIEILMDVMNSTSRSFTIPEGYVYSNIPNDRVIRSSFGLFILDYNVEGRSLVVSGSMLIPAQQIQPENVKLYNEFLTEVKEAVGKGIAIVKLADTYGEDIISEGAVEPMFASRFEVKELPENIEKIAVEEGVE